MKNVPREKISEGNRRPISKCLFGGNEISTGTLQAGTSTREDFVVGWNCVAWRFNVDRFWVMYGFRCTKYVGYLRTILVFAEGARVARLGIVWRHCFFCVCWRCYVRVIAWRESGSAGNTGRGCCSMACDTRSCIAQ